MSDIKTQLLDLLNTLGNDEDIPEQAQEILLRAIISSLRIMGYRLEITITPQKGG